MPGIVIDGRFEIEQTLGKSEFTQQYRARDSETGQPAFIKVIRPNSADSNETLQRQLQEYQLLRKLDHPNSVKVIKAGLTAENAFYVATEFVEGLRLSQRVDEQGGIDPEELADYLDQLAAVLDVAHGYGIVHRDLSLRNILLHEDGEGGTRCRLVGFGSAKSLLDSVNVTQAGLTLGSPNYMSPEQAMGRKVTKLSDIYSLGVVLFTALTGRLPFVGKSDMMTMVAHVKSPVPSFLEVNPTLNCPSTVEMVVQQALSKEPAYRPKSAGELAKMFREALTHPDRLPAGLAELQQAAARAIKIEEPVNAPSAETTSKWSGFTLVLVVGAIATGALVGYVLSQ